MKLYLVRGIHPTQGGCPTKATFDVDEANAAAAELVTILNGDLLALVADGGEPIAIEADRWQAVLPDVQAMAYAHEDGCTVDEAREYLKAFSSDGVAVEARCDVWIEEIDVELPKAKPTELAIILDGGLVQHAVVRDGPSPRVVVIDYDVEGADEEDLTPVEQGEGRTVDAAVHETMIGRAWGEGFWTSLESQPDEIDCGQCEGTGHIAGGLGGDGDDEGCPVCDGSGRIANPELEPEKTDA